MALSGMNITILRSPRRRRSWNGQDDFVLRRNYTM